MLKVKTSSTHLVAEVGTIDRQQKKSENDKDLFSRVQNGPLDADVEAAIQGPDRSSVEQALTLISTVRTGVRTELLTNTIPQQHLTDKPMQVPRTKPTGHLGH
mmetsp:Transcript_13340/g.36792  ORF Transcript_13340/g.36792 Transcript_13340/m.36792 type:complete len:103 (-) Transcript_13340:1142-1450(-)